MLAIMATRRIMLWLILALAFAGRSPLPASAQTPDARRNLFRRYLTASTEARRSPISLREIANRIQPIGESLIGEPFTHGHRLGRAPVPRFVEAGGPSCLRVRRGSGAATAALRRRFTVDWPRRSIGASPSTPRAPPHCIEPPLPQGLFLSGP